MTRVATALCVAFCLTAALAAAGDKPPNWGTTKFKDLAKHLNLTAAQQAKIKPNVEKIQDLVKRAARLPGSGWRGGYAGGGRLGSPGDWGRRPPSAATGAGSKQSAEQREEWQSEIEGRVLEIKGLLTPEQIAKFDAIEVPDLKTLGG